MAYIVKHLNFKKLFLLISYKWLDTFKGNVERFITNFVIVRKIEDKNHI